MPPSNNFETADWFALDHLEGEHPPGIWTCAGRYDGACGAFIGCNDHYQFFITERTLDAVIAFLQRKQNPLGRLLANIRQDVQDLREGKQAIVMDLSGRRIPRYGEKGNA